VIRKQDVDMGVRNRGAAFNLYMHRHVNCLLRLASCDKSNERRQGCSHEPSFHIPSQSKAAIGVAAFASC
jgi:hypothetical protein